tara:strand:- start:121 stop:540 length:420 start_codon:yes stop_codon:yes gene_type:complete
MLHICGIPNCSVNSNGIGILAFFAGTFTGYALRHILGDINNYFFCRPDNCDKESQTPASIIKDTQDKECETDSNIETNLENEENNENVEETNDSLASCDEDENKTILTDSSVSSDEDYAKPSPKKKENTILEHKKGWWY